MADNKRIKTALVSVFHKDGLDELLSLLHNHGVKFLSTGGTKSFIDGLGYECEAVVSHKSSLHSSYKRPFGLHIVQSTPILDIPILLESFRLATRQKTSPVCTYRQIWRPPARYTYHFSSDKHSPKIQNYRIGHPKRTSIESYLLNLQVNTEIAFKICQSPE